MVLFLPFLIGGATGISIAFVGAAFPILISIIHAMGEDHLMLPYMLLAYTGGFIGVMLSPLHLCFILSNTYFKIKMPAVYSLLWKPCLILIGCSFCYFLILKFYF